MKFKEKKARRQLMEAFAALVKRLFLFTIAGKAKKEETDGETREAAGETDACNSNG